MLNKTGQLEYAIDLWFYVCMRDITAYFCCLCVVPHNIFISQHFQMVVVHICFVRLCSSFSLLKREQCLMVLCNVILKVRGQKRPWGVFYQNVKIQGFCTWKFSGFKIMLCRGILMVLNYNIKYSHILTAHSISVQRSLLPPHIL